MCCGSLRLLKNPFFSILFNFATSFALDVPGFGPKKEILKFVLIC